jgi:hypothetical protein
MLGSTQSHLRTYCAAKSSIGHQPKASYMYVLNRTCIELVYDCSLEGGVMSRGTHFDR